MEIYSQKQLYVFREIEGRRGVEWGLELNLEEWKVPMLREEVAKQSGCSDGPQMINLTSSGKVLKDVDGTEKLSQLGLRNNCKVMATKISVDQGKLKQECLAEEERWFYLLVDSFNFGHENMWGLFGAPAMAGKKKKGRAPQLGSPTELKPSDSSTKDVFEIGDGSKRSGKLRSSGEKDDEVDRLVAAIEGSARSTGGDKGKTPANRLIEERSRLSDGYQPEQPSGKLPFFQPKVVDGQKIGRMADDYMVNKSRVQYARVLVEMEVTDNVPEKLVFEDEFEAEKGTTSRVVKEVEGGSDQGNLVLAKDTKEEPVVNPLDGGSYKGSQRNEKELDPKEGAGVGMNHEIDKGNKRDKDKKRKDAGHDLHE
ncbi:OLC1v1030421C1 [Oldenlandia corymbosa var. corymbosa]|uniref:OLC1v1030421C1 n=1 Tax=Oldenlandia corymbosa var. corymbosa TaxID=529605 RepID=A0AAV1CFY3_OLDCO|nr:OLC1v1030421C1 [Oldenlandia corymbosa var. corymbosa]